MNKLQYSSNSDNTDRQCFCIGRQWVNGELEPACPCAMRGQKMAERKCLWDSVSEEDKKKPMFLSCNCGKCSPVC